MVAQIRRRDRHDIAAQIALRAVWPVSVPGQTVNRFLPRRAKQTIALAAQRVIACYVDF